MRERFGRRSSLNSGDKTDRHFDNRALSQDFQKLDGEVTKWHMVGRDLVGARKESVFIPLRFGHSRGPSIEVGKNAAWGCKYPISSELNTEKNRRCPTFLIWVGFSHDRKATKLRTSLAHHVSF